MEECERANMTIVAEALYAVAGNVLCFFFILPALGNERAAVYLVTRNARGTLQLAWRARTRAEAKRCCAKDDAMTSCVVLVSLLPPCRARGRVLEWRRGKLKGHILFLFVYSSAKGHRQKKRDH